MAQAHLAVAGAAVCFGSTFIVVQGALAHAGALPFLAARFIVASALLLVFTRHRPLNRKTLVAGGWCGISLLIGYVFQTLGLEYTTTTISAFVTYLLVVIVPVLSALILRRRPSLAVGTGAGLAAIGLFLMAGTGLELGRGELLTLGSAFAFAVNIVLVAAWINEVDVVWLTIVQLAVVGLGCLGPGFVTGGYGFGWGAWWAVIFTAVAASALAFSLQLWGQRHVGPSRTSLLLMLEPVTAFVIGHFEGETLGISGAIGALLILGGILLAEVPLPRRPRPIS
ncbi:MAG: DMT family transporter [Acidimicrobiales bacterium]